MLGVSDVKAAAPKLGEIGHQDGEAASCKTPGGLNQPGVPTSLFHESMHQNEARTGISTGGTVKVSGRAGDGEGGLDGLPGQGAQGGDRPV